MSSPLPTVYATDHSPSVIRTHSARTVSNSAAYLIPHLNQRPSVTILDVGCGPGSITLDLARLVSHSQGHVTGVDYTPEPLEEARKLASSAGQTNVSFQVADVHALPFADDLFDIVHAHQVLQHIADPVRALREMRRVVKHGGGIVACRESAAMSWYPPSKGLELWQDVSARLGVARGGNPHPGNRIHAWAKEAGFGDRKVTRSAGAWCFASEEERAYWGGSFRERVKSSGFTTMAVGEGLATEEDLGVMEEAWGGFVQDPDAWFGVLHGEILCEK